MFRLWELLSTTYQGKSIKHGLWTRGAGGAMNTTSCGKKVSFKKTIVYCFPDFYTFLRTFFCRMSDDKMRMRDFMSQCFPRFAILAKMKWRSKIYFATLFVTDIRELFFSQLMIGSYGKSREVKTPLNTLYKFSWNFVLYQKLVTSWILSR